MQSLYLFSIFSCSLKSLYLGSIGGSAGLSLTMYVAALLLFFESVKGGGDCEIRLDDKALANEGICDVRKLLLILCVIGENGL
ncbi:MAG: hypothetical protein LBP31_00620 [Holosporales bacterium]|nr:hypothetical protein [Holosporales bacterium]